MSHKAIVLDANILIRAVLGKRVRELLIDHADRIKFFAPDGNRLTSQNRGSAVQLRVKPSAA